MWDNIKYLWNMRSRIKQLDKIILTMKKTAYWRSKQFREAKLADYCRMDEIEKRILKLERANWPEGVAFTVTSPSTMKYGPVVSSKITVSKERK